MKILPQKLWSVGWRQTDTHVHIYTHRYTHTQIQTQTHRQTDRTDYMIVANLGVATIINGLIGIGLALQKTDGNTHNIW